ncbi:hypothetical protein ETD86_29110 [Nonomuraea turkmeniaca]|uniref:DUF3558 domain-containing protein n=1 Tax=Nonomuraea turkmeniaca TaxID=103838 RepID=A0A5S4FAG8_9ACTN|nr:hypothetical protein [Nonomuraea turkmeniaca]TMR14210.1 hypothetical protein ETD86_29110 [Nonomuraea turkmeniaca]
MLIAVAAVLAVVLIAGLGVGWMLLRPGGGDGSFLSSTGERRSSVRPPSPTGKGVKTAEAVKLRPITGDQLCAAIPDDVRKSLVTDGKYGGKDSSTSAATASEKRAACKWSNNKMDVGDGVIGFRSLSISVEAKSTERQNAVEYAKEQFDNDKEEHQRRVNVRDGKRVDGRTSGSAFGELKELEYGDASYSQSSFGHSGLKANVFVRLGPWLIQVEYGGDNRSGNKYPNGDEVRAAAGKVAELITAEMAKDPGKVKLTGPCATLTAKNIESAFFPTAEGPSVGGNDGRIQQTTCTWRISEAVKHEPGQGYTSRGGELRIHVVDWGGGGTGSAFQFDRDAKKYDRYRAKGGIGDDNIHVDYEPRQELSGLGEKAFAVVSTTTRPGRPDEAPRKEILIKVLIGERTVDFTFRGTTAGGGVVGAQGYKEPVFESSSAQRAVAQLAKSFLAGLK